MLLMQVEEAGGKADPSSPGKEGALLERHDGGTQQVGSAITTRAVAKRVHAHKTNERWRREIARYMYEAR